MWDSFGDVENESVDPDTSFECALVELGDAAVAAELVLSANSDDDDDDSDDDDDDDDDDDAGGMAGSDARAAPASSGQAGKATVELD